MSQVLVAEIGREVGSRPSGRLRRAGKVPAVVYGLGMEPTSVALDWPSLRRVLNENGVSSPIRLSVNGAEVMTVVKELQRDPVKRDVIHIDFLAVDPDEVINVEVPLVIAGLDELSNHDAALVLLVVRTLEVIAKPSSIPNDITVDVAGIMAGGEIRVRDLTMPDGVTTEVDPDLVVASTPTPDAEATDGAEAEASDGD